MITIITMNIEIYNPANRGKEAYMKASLSRLEKVKLSYEYDKTLTEIRRSYRNGKSKKRDARG